MPMTLSQLAVQQPAIELLQRSLDRGRLGHAYLFTGAGLDCLTDTAVALTQTLHCQNPARRGAAGLPLDACGQCVACRKIAHANHPDVYWARAESKTRIIQVEQIRELIRELNLRPTESVYKTAILVAADRMRAAAANAFLKTLEEPPDNTVILLLSTEPQQLLETILSRCLRLNLTGGGPQVCAETEAWLREFAGTLAATGQSWLERYRLLGVLTSRLAQLRAALEERMREKADAEQYADADPALLEQREEELKAALEAEYRRQRGDLLRALEWWLRDVWLATLGVEETLVAFPALAAATRKTAARLKPQEAMSNLLTLEQTALRLHTNAQEALVLEVGLLKMKL